MSNTMIEQFNAARNVSVPLVVIRTADTVSTVDAIRKASDQVVDDKKVQMPVCEWDAVRGLVGANKAGEEQLRGTKEYKQSETIDFVAALRVVAFVPKGTVVCIHHAQRQLMSSEPSAMAQPVQAVSNLRDLLKKDFRMLVLMGPHFPIPAELDQDVVVLTHELPGIAELGEMMHEVHVSAKLAQPSKENGDKAVRAMLGLSLFSAEQQLSMSLSEEGIDMNALWERKRVAIEQTRGLRVWRGTETFKDLVGLENLKAMFHRRMKAKTPIGVVVFMDEIDKMLANVEHDTSGVRMDQLRTLLTEMENSRWHGAILVGVPGAGKSAIAKALGNEAGVPTVALDLGDMEGSLVGESEARVRQAVSVIKAVGGGHAFFVATSNASTVMRPELQRRFTKGVFFCDLMTAEQRDATWKLYLKKYGLDVKAERPNDDGWTGAEIRNCVEEAWDTGVTLKEAATQIVSMAQSRGDEVKRLRDWAHGRCLDAEKPGTFNVTEQVMENMLRAIKIPGKAN